MRRYIFLFVLFLCGFFLLSSCKKEVVEKVLPDMVDVSFLDSWLNELCLPKYEGRKSGTKGNTLAREFISEELKGLNYIAEIQEATDEKKRKYYNIIADIDNKSTKTIFIGAHYDGAVASAEYPAANDNASGVSSLLLLAKKLKYYNNPEFNYKLIFFDGEERQQDGHPFNGSSYFVSKLTEFPLFYVNLDMIGNNEMRHRVETTSNKLLEDIRHISSKYRGSLDIEFGDRIIKHTQDFVPFHAIQIPIFTWRNPSKSRQDRFNHTPNDKIENLSLEKIWMITNMTYELILGEDLYTETENS